MKKIIDSIFKFIIELFTFKVKEEPPIINEIETPKQEIVEEPIIEPKEEEKPQEPIIDQTETKEPEKPIENTTNEPYKMLSLQERQTYLKKLGLYTKEIDGKRGPGHKKAEKQFNIIFLNNGTDTYTEETDKLLRIIYNSYCSSKYMQDSDWQYFKNLRKSEYKCKCKGKYCNGYPHDIAMHLVMTDQYIRNYFGVSIKITSGVRCEKHNSSSAVGGAKNSNHLKGCASDKNNGKPAKDVRAVAKQLPFVGYSYDITDKAVHTTVNL